MTVQETIKQLKCDMELITFNPNNGEVIPVECLNDLNRATYEADKMAISALEKQISKKPKKMNYKPFVDFGWEYACAICGCAVGENQHDDGEFTQKDDYCPNCGQAIDWSENNNG